MPLTLRAAPALIQPDPDRPTITIDGKAYAGWQEFRVTRAIDRAVADFDCKSAPYGGVDADPFSACEIRLGRDLVLTGYVDANFSAIDGHATSTRITGRSKTEDLVDCTPNIAGGEFRGHKLDAIARAVCAPFGIEVVVSANVGEAFEIATFERDETGFEFLERLGRLRGVLLTDDPQGRLVLAQTAGGEAEGRLAVGDNIVRAQATLNMAKRHKEYVVLAQRGSAAGYVVTPVPETEPPGGGAQPQISATAEDLGVPRFRRRVTVAEDGLSAGQARQRAVWQARYFAARSSEARITVRGWRRTDGTLWAVNSRVHVAAEHLKLNREMLIAAVSYQFNDEDGRTTILTVGPPEGYTPDPGQVRVRSVLSSSGLRYPVISIR